MHPAMRISLLLGCGIVLGLLIVACSVDASSANLYNISYGEHRPISVDIVLLSLTEINGQDETFQCDFFFSEAYQDNTHNVTTAWDEEIDSSTGGSPTYDHLEIEFVNSQSVTEQYKFVYASWAKPLGFHYNSSVPDVVGIPWIRVESRYQGVFKTSLGLQDFPFDHQAITLQMESSNHEIHQGEFVIDPHSNMLSLLGDLVEWEVEGSSKRVTTNYYHVFNETYSRADFSIYIKRNPVFFLDKIVSGVAMLVVMSWCLFCVDVMDSNRQTTAATTFLAVITYLNIITNDVPKVPYTTRLGQFITLSMFQIFFSYLIFSVNCGVQRNANQALQMAIEARDKKNKKKNKKRKQNALKTQEAKETLAEHSQSKPPLSLDGSRPQSPTEDNGDRSGVINGNGGTAETNENAWVAGVEAESVEGKENGAEEEDEDDEEEPVGWWTTWSHVRPLMELVFVTCLILSYTIATPLILRQTGDGSSRIVDQTETTDAGSSSGGH